MVQTTGGTRHRGDEQAFPSVGEGFGNTLYSAPGMTIRQLVAAMAMQGILSNPQLRLGQELRIYAEDAIAWADALIAAEAEGRET